MVNSMDIALLIIVIIGLIGTLFPAVPGSVFIFAGALFHGIMTDFTPLSWPVMMILGVLFLCGWLGQYMIAAAGSRKLGASRYGVIGAGIGLFFGFILPIPGGILMGAFAGALLAEFFFGDQELRQAMRAGIGALAGTIAAMFFEFLIGLIMTAVIAVRFYH